jgi:hypothetical protein
MGLLRAVSAMLTKLNTLLPACINTVNGANRRLAKQFSILQGNPGKIIKQN